MGRKESNQTKKQKSHEQVLLCVIMTTIFILSMNTLSFSGPLIDRLPVMNLPTNQHR